MPSASDATLLWLGLAPLLLWLLLSLHVLLDRMGHDARFRGLAAAARQLKDPALSGLPLAARMARARQVVSRLPEQSLQRLVADPQLPRWARDACTMQALLDRPLPRVLRRARRRHGRATRWQRVGDLSLLVQARHPDSHDLLRLAITDADAELRHAAIGLLGDLTDRDAAAILVEALRRPDPLRSRIAAHLDQFPLDIGPLLLPLVAAAEPATRAWGALLLGRYPGLPGVRERLVELAGDAEANVRKAAAQSLASMRGAGVADAARRLVADPVPFVRAHGARALAAIEGAHAAAVIAPLLADGDWWVRQAAKESLLSMGEAAVPQLDAQLDSPDRFARNGAAEVLQGLGLMPRLLALRGHDSEEGRRADAFVQRIGAAAEHGRDWLRTPAAGAAAVHRG